jgi:hypothetical protein
MLLANHCTNCRRAALVADVAVASGAKQPQCAVNAAVAGCPSRTHAVTMRTPDHIPVRARMRVSTGASRATCSSPAARRAVPSARPGPCPSTPKSCYFMNAGHLEGGAPGRILSPANFGSRDLPVPAPRPALRGQEGARVDRNRDTRPSWASADRSCVASAIAGHAPVAVSKAPSVSASLVARCRARLRSRSGALCVGSAGPLHRDPLRWLGGKPESS